MSQTLYVLQGVPGSGKSHLAEMIKLGHNYGNNIAICSTDIFHLENVGGGKSTYVFKPEKSKQYHALNQTDCRYQLEQGRSVIVDNTNIRCWEARPYVEMAVIRNIPVVFIRVTSNFKSIHGVSEETISGMKENMEDLTVESCLNAKYPWEITVSF
jgi:predicted kinase